MSERPEPPFARPTSAIGCVLGVWSATASASIGGWAPVKHSWRLTPVLRGLGGGGSDHGGDRAAARAAGVLSCPIRIPAVSAVGVVASGPAALFRRAAERGFLPGVLVGAGTARVVVPNCPGMTIDWRRGTRRRVSIRCRLSICTTHCRLACRGTDPALSGDGARYAAMLCCFPRFVMPTGRLVWVGAPVGRTAVWARRLRPTLPPPP